MTLDHVSGKRVDLVVLLNANQDCTPATNDAANRSRPEPSFLQHLLTSIEIPLRLVVALYASHPILAYVNSAFIGF
jgi:hypothetical protein